MAGFSRPPSAWRYTFDGLCTNNPPDAVDPKQYPVAVNVRALEDDAIRTRPGYSLLATALSAACPVDTGGVVGIPYSSAVIASGGVGPYTYELTDPIYSPLPDGLTLNPSTGAITGTPTAEGTFIWSVTVTDTLGDSTESECTISIDLTFAILACPSDNPVINTPYSFTFEAIGGVPPYTWALEYPDEFPDGLTLDPDTGEITGTPTESGTFNFTVIVTDSTFNTATISCQFVIAALACIVVVRPQSYVLGCRTGSFGVGGRVGAFIDGTTSFDEDYNASNSQRDYWWNNYTPLGGIATPGAFIDGSTSTYAEGRYGQVSTFFEYRKLIGFDIPPADPDRTLLDVTIVVDVETIWHGGSGACFLAVDMWNHPGGPGEIYTLNDLLFPDYDLVFIPGCMTQARAEHTTVINGPDWPVDTSVLYTRAFLAGVGSSQPPMDPQQQLLVYDIRFEYRYC